MVVARWMRTCGWAAVWLGVWSATGAALEPAKVPGPISREQIGQLINQLGDNDYFVRERAQQELSQIGIEAFDALNEAENRNDLEIADRARFLIRLMRVEWVVDSDPPEVKRLMKAYETDNYDSRDEHDRLQVVQKLAELPADQGLASLCRIVRFEKNQLLAKQAALQVIPQKIDEKKIDDKQWAARAKAIAEGIGRSPRPPADWLRTYVAAQNDPQGAVGGWAKLAEAETRALRQYPQQSRAQLVIGLWKQEVAALERAHRSEDALAAMRQMVALEPDDSDSLSELLGWLVERKAWAVVDEAAKRYADRFEQDPVLLYTLAQACEAQGNKVLAQETAERALKLNPDNQRQHLLVAFKLQQRGRFVWSELEYRKTIGIGPPGQSDTLRAHAFLAEMLHDQADDLPAAKSLDESAQAMEERIRSGRPLDELEGDINTTRARMHYFYACHAASTGDRAKQIEELEKGLEQDRTDADVLIALFRIPDLDPPLKEKTRRLIRAATEEFRNQIQQSPDNSTPYNQLAWLVGNTEGDYQEALRCSQKSNELRPNVAGYLDTLGRCYYALGDYANAVEFQSKAIELDPHSGQMNRQLVIFREALAKAEAKKPKKADDKK
jgi:tetratricopeptide (TPR) repeat protein